MLDIAMPKVGLQGAGSGIRIALFCCCQFYWFSPRKARKMV
jgi:hypothetical protein